MHWPFLEKSGPKKWVVEATLALKQNFLAGKLILTCNIYTVPFMSTVSQEGWKAKVLIIETVTCTVYFTIPERKNWGKGRDPLPLPFRHPSLSFIYPACHLYIQLFLRNIVGKNAHSNPERYFGWFLVHGSSKKVWKDGMRGHGCMFASAKAISP